MKTLISALGTGINGKPYRTTNYKFENSNKKYETNFVSDAIARHLNIDRMLIIGTSKSIWQHLYYHMHEELNDEISEKLFDGLAEYSNVKKNFKEDIQEETEKYIDKYLKKIIPGSPGGSKVLIVNAGLNQDELQENIILMYNTFANIKKDEDLYIDITHAFRSMPIMYYMILEMINTKFNGSVKVKGMYYGAFEARDVEENVTPIVNISKILEVSKMIRGLNEFTTYGSGYDLVDSLNNSPSFSEYDSNLSKKLLEVSNLLNLNYLVELKTSFTSLSKKEKRVNNEIESLEDIFKDMLSEYVEPFTNQEKDSEFQLKMSKWYYDNKRYANAYICLAESIITKICEVYNVDGTNYTIREDIKKLFTNRVFLKRENTNKDYMELIQTYYYCNNTRNKIAHASFIKNKSDERPETSIKKFKIQYFIIKKIFKNEILKELPLRYKYLDLKAATKF